MNGRVYDPEIGRFIQADSEIPDAGDLQAFNRYSYVLNNPLAYTDPSGHWPHWPHWGHAWHAWHDFTHSVSSTWHSVTHTIANIWHQNPLEWAMASTFREVGREFAKVPALQVVADVVLVCIPGGAAFLPLLNAAIAATVTYASGGNFSAILMNAAVAYAATYVVQQAANYASSYADSLGESCNLASERMGSMVANIAVGGAIAKAQGGKFFDSKAFVEGMAISTAVSWMMTPTATTETNQGKVAGDSGWDACDAAGNCRTMTMEEVKASSLDMMLADNSDFQAHYKVDIFGFEVANGDYANTPLTPVTDVPGLNTSFTKFGITFDGAGALDANANIWATGNVSGGLSSVFTFKTNWQEYIGDPVNGVTNNSGLLGNAARSLKTPYANVPQ